jgi:hypothetical protein
MLVRLKSKRLGLNIHRSMVLFCMM